MSTVQSGTANSPDNFIETTEEAVFTTDSSMTTVDITLPDNYLVEGDTAFTVMLSNPIEGVLSPSEPTSAEVTIIDNDSKCTVLYEISEFVI